MRRKRFTAVFLSLMAVILILAVASVLYARYQELTDFSNRLSNLVAARTKGHYRLRIEKEEKDFFKLRVTFRNIYLERAGGDSTKNHIESVFIPRIAVNIGSLRSWLMDRQIDVKTFVVEEPVVNVRATGKRNHNVTITQNLLDIYPAVEEVLNNFIIHSFTVERGNLKIDNSSKEVINLRLIDFLVHEWNMRDLDGNSHLALHIGQQDLPIDRSTLSFSAIEFQYPQHYLLFKDLSFTSRDTLSQSQLSVKNANILIEGLDYDELYHHERYKLKKIEVQHPQISGTLHLAHGRKGRSRDLLANLMRQTFGEASLDSAILKKANIDLTFANGKDSINTQLPEVDISLANFAIPKENKELQIGSVHINLNATAIRLNDDVVLHCDGLGFGRNRHLDIENARLTRAAGGAPFIQCRRIHLKSFQLLDFIFDKHLSADSVLLEDADVSLSRADLSLFPHAPTDSAQRKKVLLNLGVLELRNVNFDYRDTAQSITAKGVHARFYRIHEPALHAIVRQLSGAEAQTVSFEDRGRMLKGYARKVVYKTHGFRAGQLNVSTRTVSLQARNIHARPVFTSPSDIDVWHWEEVAAGYLSITGSLPESSKHTDNDEGDHNLRLDILTIANMTADIRFGETKVSFTGKTIRGRALTSRRKAAPDLTGTIYNFDLVTPKTQVQADSFALALNRRSTGYQVRVTRGDLKLLIPYASIGRITQDTQSTTVAYLRARKFEARRNNETLVSSDSIMLRSILLTEGRKPVMDELAAYGLTIPEGTSRKNKTSSFEWPEGIGKINVYNGKIFLRNQKTFRFNHIESHQDHSVALDSGWYFTPNNTIRLGGVNMRSDALSVGLLQVMPTAAYLKSVQTENDIIQGTLRGVTLTQFEADSILNGGPIIANEMKLASIQLSIRRDKRLPDGPLMEKPFFLHELLPDRFHVRKLTVADGTIAYSETSEKTGKTGDIVLQNLQATIAGINGRELSQGIDLDARASLYGQAPFAVQYHVLNPDQFMFKLTVEPFDLTALNRVMVPLQSIEIRSGRLQSFSVEVLAGREHADGFATMSYRDLHLEIQKTGEPGKKNLGKSLSNTFLTFVADGLILRNNKTRAKAAVHQGRIAEKSAFNYWIKIATHGALNVLRHGKQEKQEALEESADK